MLSTTWVAGVTGLEPAASGVTGRRSNQLSYTPKSSGTPDVSQARAIPSVITGIKRLTKTVKHLHGK